MINESILASVPDTTELATPEELPFGVNFAPRMTEGETLDEVVSVTLTDVNTGRPAPSSALSRPATISGQWAMQWLRGVDLKRGQGQYVFVITVRIGPEGRAESSITVFDVRF